MAVDQIDNRYVVFIDLSGTILRVSNFQKDGTKVFSMLGCCDSSKKLSFPSLDMAVVD